MQVSQFIDDKIKENEALIVELVNENRALMHKKENQAIQSGINKWLDYTFESSSGLTEEFAQFARDFKKELIKVIKPDFELINYSRGHFEISGFLKDKYGKFIYFSTSDVRYFKNEWFNNILIRTAQHDKDYTGGRNCSTTWQELPTAIKSL